MKLRHRFAQFAIVGVLALSAAGTATAGSRRDTNTILGVGLGALAGAVVTQGDPLVTLGGAAAGGILGNILTSDHRGYRDVRVYEPRRAVRYVHARPVRYYRSPAHRGWDRRYR